MIPPANRGRWSLFTPGDTPGDVRICRTCLDTPWTCPGVLYVVHIGLPDMSAQLLPRVSGHAKPEAGRPGGHVWRKEGFGRSPVHAVETNAKVCFQSVCFVTRGDSNESTMEPSTRCPPSYYSELASLRSLALTCTWHHQVSVHNLEATTPSCSYAQGNNCTVTDGRRISGDLKCCDGLLRRSRSTRTSSSCEGRTERLGSGEEAEVRG